MMRHCDGKDPNLVRQVGNGAYVDGAYVDAPSSRRRWMPCDCGLRFDDVDHSVVYPHVPIVKDFAAIKQHVAAMPDGEAKDGLMRQRPGVGGPGHARLNHFGLWVYEAYQETPYLVGTAAFGKTWRDVDVRLMLPDEVFDRLYAPHADRWQDTPLWSLHMAALSALGEQITGLPVDFQIQPQTHANEHYSGKVRVPLGIWIKHEWLVS